MSENTSMTPREIVAELDHHIIGQNEAKRSVAIAVRDRWRRSKLRELDKPSRAPSLLRARQIR